MILLFSDPEELTLQHLPTNEWYAIKSICSFHFSSQQILSQLQFYDEFHIWYLFKRKILSQQIFSIILKDKKQDTGIHSIPFEDHAFTFF